MDLLDTLLIRPSRVLPSTLLYFYFTFLDIFVFLGPASASNQEEMLGSSEEAPPEGSVLDSACRLDPIAYTPRESTLSERTDGHVS